MHDEATIIVDTRESLENIRVLAMHTGSAIEIVEEPGGVYSIRLRRGRNAAAHACGSQKSGSERNDGS